ncbi:glycoside hydrolase family 1 protein [Streptomyces sp. NBC_00576]|uniref:glycoside hydrolase family 1 protein n=1 Tax=Streptomyces sp. NBC_00576 TaxID=2903665 RepID=UPI002E805C0F|nr:family 1 glycosylhydrolase [Streptomyces sp. NBC_00576]WUB72583.1 family 1 glycosylhydrolase [Streptomyces sp. NBC_00576]
MPATNAPTTTPDGIPDGIPDCAAEGLPFPEGFLWGASTAAHQIEGNNVNSDWWQLEHSGDGRIAEPSLDAADSYHRWPEDMDLLAQLGFTDYRFSIEWARIEPAPGHFSRAELAHYRRMVDGALERGLRPMVTLHHFTLPRWFADRGGWTAEGAIDLWERYVRATAPVIGTDVRHVCTINEPNMIAVADAIRKLGAAAGETPTAGTPLPDKATTDALIQAHHRATAVIRSFSASGDIRVGWSIANQVYQPLPGAEAATAAYSHPREDVFIEAARDDDWIGVQSYTRTRIDPDGHPVPAPAEAERTLTGWEFYPQALGHALRHTARIVGAVPLIVTENGIATSDDTRRIAYTTGALQEVTAALEDGLDVHGYLHWSALDNYEWGSYKPTFGLIEINPDTFERTPRPSAVWLGGLARAGVLPRA